MLPANSREFSFGDGATKGHGLWTDCSGGLNFSATSPCGNSLVAHILIEGRNIRWRCASDRMEKLSSSTSISLSTGSNVWSRGAMEFTVPDHVILCQTVAACLTAHDCDLRGFKKFSSSCVEMRVKVGNCVSYIIPEADIKKAKSRSVDRGCRMCV